jgi:AcrR family transcriptional regulator
MRRSIRASEASNTASAQETSASSLQRRAEIGEERRARTRRTILEAAIAVLGHESGRLATVDDVIGKAGVSRGTFYNYFEGRDQLLEAVAHQLSHDFNEALDRSIGDSNPALRAATFTRQYLRRMRADPRWGWAAVNVGLNGRHLFGEATFAVARDNIARGRKLGVFNVPNADAALDISVGTVFSSGLTILRDPTKPDHPEAAAYMLLLALGVPAAKARDYTSKPLAKLPGFDPT